MLGQLLYQGPSLTDLHDKYAKRQSIDTRAPIISYDEVIIDASVNAVWQTLLDMQAWPSFNPLIGDVQLESPVAAGTKAALKIGGIWVRITFATVSPCQELAWTGAALWTRAVERLVLEPISAAATRLRLEESLAGAFVTVFFNSAGLQAQHITSLNSFKQASEGLYARAGG